MLDTQLACHMGGGSLMITRDQIGLDAHRTQRIDCWTRAVANDVGQRDIAKQGLIRQNKNNGFPFSRQLFQPYFINADVLRAHIARTADKNFLTVDFGLEPLPRYILVIRDRFECDAPFFTFPDNPVSNGMLRVCF